LSVTTGRRRAKERYHEWKKKATITSSQGGGADTFESKKGISNGLHPMGKKHLKPRPPGGRPVEEKGVGVLGRRLHYDLKRNFPEGKAAIMSAG